MNARLLGAMLTLLASCCLPIAASAACSPSGPTVRMKGSGQAPFNVLLEIQPRRIVVSAPFQVHVTLCAERPVSINRVKIDATMPRHRHGMNYMPTVRKAGEGRYAATGLLFHMPGLWRIEVSVHADGETQRFFHDIEIQ